MATPLQSCEYIRSRIDTDQDIDYFVFQAEKGVSYLVESEMGDLAAIALTLLERRGEIASDDNYRHTGQPARIDWQPPANGPYWIAANGRGPGWEATPEPTASWSRRRPSRSSKDIPVCFRGDEGPGIGL